MQQVTDAIRLDTRFGGSGTSGGRGEYRRRSAPTCTLVTPSCSRSSSVIRPERTASAADSTAGGSRTALPITKALDSAGDRM